MLLLEFLPLRELKTNTIKKNKEKKKKKERKKGAFLVAETPRHAPKE